MLELPAFDTPDRSVRPEEELGVGLRSWREVEAAVGELVWQRAEPHD